MISKKLQDMLSEQAKNEFYSAYLYLSMSAWFSSKGLDGLAKWFGNQVHEEEEHGLKIINYLLKVDGTPEFPAIEAPESDFASVMDVFEKTLAHEQAVTAAIYEIMTQAVEERDYKTQQFLEWYVNEQIEEEENARHLIDKLKISQKNDGGLLIVDAEASERNYTPIDVE